MLAIFDVRVCIYDPQLVGLFSRSYRIQFGRKSYAITPPPPHETALVKWAWSSVFVLPYFSFFCFLNIMKDGEVDGQILFCSRSGIFFVCALADWLIAIHLQIAALAADVSSSEARVQQGSATIKHIKGTVKTMEKDMKVRYDAS